MFDQRPNIILYLLTYPGKPSILCLLLVNKFELSDFEFNEITRTTTEKLQKLNQQIFVRVPITARDQIHM